MPSLFPADPENAAYFVAAWKSYVVFNRAWIPVFKILEESYGLAIDRLDRVPEKESIAGSPREHLGEHFFFLRIMG